VIAGRIQIAVSEVQTMRNKLLCILLAVVLALSFFGCGGKENSQAASEQVKKAAESFQTTAKVKYRELETVMTIYKKPMNCAVVGFESPDSLRDMKMTFYPDKVALQYKEMSFDFAPDSLPGQAAAKMVLSALNAALADEGITVEQQDKKLLVSGTIDEGAFSLVIDAENGNILKLVIPEKELELEVLNFKILE